ncbi:hypothetical protein THRCLA_05276 [Thraustotheca clavata]|uniref:Ankyrin repeat n=1 Tax=Thraustotheca clavata TaxID=74557 RepID=A0A1V9ZWI8_9STRA|nr:hypothetical protein THRCLA_05276 [Thraustotheca clavata]
MDGATTYGHLEMVEFLNENRTQGYTSKALKGAIYNGYAEVVEYLLSHRIEECAPAIINLPYYYGISCHRAVDKKIISVYCVA